MILLWNTRGRATRPTSYYEADGLGSVTSLTSSSSALATTYTYDSFGELTNSTGSLQNPFRYTAREFDTETNLYYYRARYYDASVGRFVSEDPIRFDGGPDFYVYVAENPINYIDPSGEIHYNYPPPRTVPVTGKTAAALQCLENCLQCLTNNPNLDLFVTGGAEQSGHTKNSYHYRNEAVDISYSNPVTTYQVFQCGESCGFSAGLSEPALHHWHLQLRPGNGVPLLPPLLPMPKCGNGGCRGGN